MVDAHLRGIRELSGGSEVKYYESLAIIGYVYAGIAYLLSIGFAVWTHRNRRTRIVKASQPIFLILICVGTFIRCSSIIPMTFDDGVLSGRGADIACMSQQWLTYPGAVLVYAAMGSKTWRANKIMDSAQRFQRVKVTAMDVMVPLQLLMTAVFIVLICWTAISPTRFTRDENSGYGKCTDDQIAFPITIAQIFNITFIITGYQAWRARNISAEFSESLYIGIIMGLSIVLSVVRSVIVARKEETETYVADATVVFLNSLLALLLIFVPKMVALRRLIRNREREEQKKRRVGSPVRTGQVTVDEPRINMVEMAPGDEMNDTVLAPSQAAPGEHTVQENEMVKKQKDSSVGAGEDDDKEEKVHLKFDNKKKKSSVRAGDEEAGLYSPPD